MGSTCQRCFAAAAPRLAGPWFSCCALILAVPRPGVGGVNNNSLGGVCRITFSPNMTSTTTSTYTTTTRHTLSRRPGRGGIATASTPNLNQVYTAHSTRLLPPALSRKTSLAALTQNSLAAIPDDSQGYAYNSVLTDTTMPSPLTPSRAASGEDIAIGDTVEVPGSMTGTVRFIGPVAGRKGTFAGVELHPDFAPRGKNSGDVDGYASVLFCFWLSIPLFFA